MNGLLKRRRAHCASHRETALTVKRHKWKNLICSYGLFVCAGFFLDSFVSFWLFFVVIFNASHPLQLSPCRSIYAIFNYTAHCPKHTFFVSIVVQLCFNVHSAAQTSKTAWSILEGCKGVNSVPLVLQFRNRNMNRCIEGEENIHLYPLCMNSWMYKHWAIDNT